MKPRLHDAIQSLAPDSEFVIRGEDLNNLEWLTPNVAQPTNQEIEAEFLRLTNEWIEKEYQRLRSLEYPGLDILLVALWESVVEGRPASVSELQAIREAIKQKYPKP